MPNVYEVITGRIIQQLESGTAPWHKPWKARGKSGLPRNLVSGREYRGINVSTLLSSGYANPQWLTFRQARQLDGHVRKGEVGFPIVYWKFGKREVEDGDEIIEKRSVLCLYYTVFNLEQCEGLKIRPAEPTENQAEVQPIEACEQVVADWQGKPVIKHGGDCASYSKVLRLCPNAGENLLRQRGGILFNAVPRAHPQHRASGPTESFQPDGLRTIRRP